MQTFLLKVCHNIKIRSFHVGRYLHRGQGWSIGSKEHFFVHKQAINMDIYNQKLKFLY